MYNVVLLMFSCGRLVVELSHHNDEIRILIGMADRLRFPFPEYVLS